jgi:hypothetical protein
MVKQKKKILIMGDYFYPDFASTGQLLTELCLELQNDYFITVITSVPSKIEYRFKENINFENYENIRLVRVKTAKFNKRVKVSRIKHIFEHYMQVKKAIKMLSKQDIILSISQPPILGGLQGLYAKKIHGGKFIYSIQDFNPEQAEAIGYVKNKALMDKIREIDIETCKKADINLIVGRDMVDTLKKRKIFNKNKTVLINNWIDEKKVYPISSKNRFVMEFKKKYNLLNKFVIMYSGNIGLYYDLENIIKVIARFSNYRNVVFAFVGDGAKKRDLEYYVRDNEIENVRFIPFQEKDKIIYSLNAADVHIVANQKNIKGVSFPSKIYGVMAVGKFIMGILEEGSEALNLIKESKCGLYVNPQDYGGIYKMIKMAIEFDKRKIYEIGLNGRAYLEKKLTKDSAINKYRILFDNI